MLQCGRMMIRRCAFPDLPAVKLSHRKDVEPVLPFLKTGVSLPCQMLRKRMDQVNRLQACLIAG